MTEKPFQNLPKHLRPLSDNTKPGGQMHWKPPGVLVQEPKRQMLGSSSHSFISAEEQDNLLIESNQNIVQYLKINNLSTP